MTFDPKLRDEKPNKPEDKKIKSEKLDKALKDTFPASDPLASESPTTGPRARKPVPLDKQ